MQSLIYYVGATLVGFFAVFMLVMIMLRGQETSVDSTQIMRAKKSLFSAIENVELDFRNVGSGKRDVSTTFAGIDTVACAESKEADCTFSFYGRADSTTADSSLIQYSWRQSGDEIIDADLSGSVDDLTNVTTYTLRRLVDGGHRFSVDRVRRFQVILRDDAGNVAAATTAVREIEIRLNVLVPTTQGDEAMEEVRWSSVFRPANLARQ